MRAGVNLFGVTPDLLLAALGTVAVPIGLLGVVIRRRRSLATSAKLAPVSARQLSGTESLLSRRRKQYGAARRGDELRLTWYFLPGVQMWQLGSTVLPLSTASLTGPRTPPAWRWPNSNVVLYRLSRASGEIELALECDRPAAC